MDIDDVSPDTPFLFKHITKRFRLDWKLVGGVTMAIILAILLAIVLSISLMKKYHTTNTIPSDTTYQSSSYTNIVSTTSIPTVEPALIDPYGFDVDFSNIPFVVFTSTPNPDVKIIHADAVLIVKHVAFPTNMFGCITLQQGPFPCCFLYTEFNHMLKHGTNVMFQITATSNDNLTETRIFTSVVA